MFFRGSHSFTGVGTGTAYLGGAEMHTWQVIVTGNPTALEVKLEGTIDGTNWFVLDTSKTVASEMRHVVNKLVWQVRPKLLTLTGGTVPTVEVAWFSGKTEMFERNDIKEVAA